jgi:hypothetical protein|tara:strand:- start:5845 stop:6348 length:504 start_codon:yes stop_codon:yes gene_type:complete
MIINTNYWKTDKLIPTEISKKIRDASQRSMNDLFFSPYRNSVLEIDDDWLSIRIPRDYILLESGYDLDDTTVQERKDMWSDLQSGTNMRDVIGGMLNRQVASEAALITNNIMDDYMDYMGIGELANKIVRDSRANSREFLYPAGQSLSHRRIKYEDNIWEKIHDEEK